MKRLFFLFFAISISCKIAAHDDHYEGSTLYEWKLRNQTIVHGTFSYKNGNYVYIENEDNELIKVRFDKLSKKDQHVVEQKMEVINTINQVSDKSKKAIDADVSQGKADRVSYGIIVFLIISIILIISLFILPSGFFRKSFPYATGVITFVLFAFAVKKDGIEKSTTDPTFVDDAFTPFKPTISTSWDDQYFYVESKGIPLTHQMMVGISSHGWQQQVPIPQCYVGSNAWKIPLNPVMSSSPIPVDSIHFTRGAIALAINGVPIFNPHTNTGVDSYLDGQLDAFGGHCGRADDYHYHIAPLHLYDQTAATKPIAFGLDGYAVYGSVEPDGSSLQALDGNHGHLGTNGVYHYHGSSSAPYMIGKMAGIVTEDTTHQIIPQPSAHPVRPSLTPLNGALITSCTPNATNNGYNITYTLNGMTDSVVYSWTNTGQYTFNFYTNGDGTYTSENQNGFVQCDIVAGITENQGLQTIKTFPNPTSDYLTIQLSDQQLKELKRLQIVDVNGVRVFQTDKYPGKVNMSSFNKGVYILKMDFKNGSITRKIILQ